MLTVPGFPPLPEGPYDLAMADPPWVFSVWSDKGKSRSAENHYACLPTAKIAMLPIRQIMARNSNLLLWSTWPHLEHALSVMNAWGFTYSSGIPWVKREPDGRPAIGTGYYWRAVSEVLLIGKRRNGKALPRLRHDLPGLLDTLKTREHSRKPAEVYTLIDQLFGTDLRRIELFARPPHPHGWMVWGLEAESPDHKSR